MKWIDAFLCFRQQRVVVNRVKQTGLHLCQVFRRAPFLVPCCFLCTSMTLCQTLSLKYDSLLMTVFAIVKLRI